jgi:hypothetical protein
MYACAHIWVCDRFIATVGAFIMKVVGKSLIVTFVYLSIRTRVGCYWIYNYPNEYSPGCRAK